MKLPIKAGYNKMKKAVYGNHGVSLVEMIVVMAVFIVVLAIAGSALQTILQKGMISLTSENSNIEGVVGLEILRHDLQQIGIGLFTDSNSAPIYTEASGSPYNSYNDASAVPRAVVGDDNNSITGVMADTDYLAIKGTTLARNATSQLWTYVGDTGVPKVWGRDDFRDSNDKVIVLDQKVDKAKNMIVRRLVQISNSNYGVAYSADGVFKDQSNVNVTNYTRPTGSTYYLYGIDSASTSFTFAAPFNRADFFVSQTPAPPAICSPAAGVLYKAVMVNTGASAGTFTKIPILDCVADMQVVLGWNTSSDPEKSNEVQAYTNADCSTVSGNVNGLTMTNVRTDAEEVRKRLRLVMVYLLAQDGRRDSGFTNTNTNMIVGDTTLGSTLTRSIDLTQTNFLNYRWKLYRVVVRPKNLF